MPPQQNEEDQRKFDEFIVTLKNYHEKRGTLFDPEPRVSTKQIDLLQLYNAVLEKGGYDRVSEEKLAWRKLGQEFNLGTANLPALAFSLKTVYYKYLAAYEISTVHKKEPPPKEILEDLTAKGGALLSRTLENFRPSARKEGGALENSEASGDDGTPARDRNESEETPGSGGRVTRGLRQAPPQRILFQPDTQPSRQTRHASSTSHLPPAQQQQHQQSGPRGASTSYNPSSNMEHMSPAVANYEPRPQIPLTLRPVTTPGNNPVGFAKLQQALATKSATLSQPKVLLPGSGFDGPNIYIRCLLSLKSGIPAEQGYALHHLVKISMERGDKYRFESFPGLAEALIEKLLEVSSLFYMVKWEIDYLLDGSMQGMNVLNGLEGTKDILKRIALLPKLHVDDNIQTAQFSDAMLLINEAGLTLRNMVLLEENAHYVSEMSPLRDFLTIALHLPKLDSLVELKHYALDIAEQLTKYISFDVADPLYISLLDHLQSFDRGTILASLRAINKISMNLEENNRLMGVPAPVVQNIMDWILLSDEDLVGACLDFLYQYTAVEQNVSFMLSKLQVDPLVVQLTRLLTHGAKVVESLFVRDRETRIPAPTALAALPQEVHAELEKMDEPERSSQWLRCLFEEDRDESVTQIFMWQAYQTRFTEMSHSTGRPLLAAAEFIKNVSTTFAEKAAAQVQPGPVQKFIIKGLRIRSTPVDLKGEEATKCKWELSNQSGQCDEFFMTPEKLYEHILKKHLNATQQEDGKFKNTHAAYDCRWGGCRRFHDSPAPSLVVIGKHIKVHFPTRKTSATKDSQKSKLSYIISPKKYSYKYQVTAVDERGEAAGIPLSAVLVLRNLARIIPKTEAEQIALKQTGVSWVDRLFKPVQPQLTEVMAHNRALTKHVVEVIGAIKDRDF